MPVFGYANKFAVFVAVLFAGSSMCVPVKTTRRHNMTTTTSELNRLAREYELAAKATSDAATHARHCLRLARSGTSNTPAFFRRIARQAIAQGKRSRTTAALRMNELTYFAARPELITA